MQPLLLGLLEAHAADAELAEAALAAVTTLLAGAPAAGGRESMGASSARACSVVSQALHTYSCNAVVATQALAAIRQLAGNVV